MSPINNSIVSIIGALVALIGSYLAFRQSTRATAVQELSAEGQAFVRVQKIYEKTIELQAQELEKSRAGKVSVEARFSVLEDEVREARSRIGELEHFIRLSGLALPPSLSSI